MCTLMQVNPSRYENPKGKEKVPKSLLTDPNYPRTYYMPHETHDYYLQEPPHLPQMGAGPIPSSSSTMKGPRHLLSKCSYNLK